MRAKNWGDLMRTRRLCGEEYITSYVIKIARGCEESRERGIDYP